jgi:phospholipid transport system substrate-binding protein
MTKLIGRRAILAGIFAAGVVLSGRPGIADANVSPSEFIASLGDRAVSALTGRELSREERETRFRELLDNHFDVPAIGKFVLGRYWRTATDEEKQEFLKLFEELLVKSYARRFAEYSGESFEVRNVRDEANGESLVQSLVVRPGAENIRVDWRLRADNSDFRILDVIVEGLSMAVTQRDEFASVIQSKGGKVAGLLEVLRQKVGQGG